MEIYISKAGITEQELEEYLVYDGPIEPDEEVMNMTAEELEAEYQRIFGDIEAKHKNDLKI